MSVHLLSVVPTSQNIYTHLNSSHHLLLISNELGAGGVVLWAVLPRLPLRIIIINFMQQQKYVTDCEIEHCDCGLYVVCDFHDFYFVSTPSRYTLCPICVFPFKLG